MADVLLLIQVLISGVISGLILFQSIFVAPVVFKELPEENRPIILRSLFPKLFKSIAVGGILFTLVTYLEGSTVLITYFVGLFTFLSGLICNSMINATNKARDEGNQERFATLHRISVMLTVSVLAVNLVWIFIA
jgi:carbon starvation protein CstA